MTRILLLLRTLVFVGGEPGIAAEHAPARIVDLWPRMPHACSTPGAVLSDRETPLPPPALYVGPTLYGGEQARTLRRTLQVLPAPVRKTFTGRVGPWGLAAESAGPSQWSAGLGMFARF